MENNKKFKSLCKKFAPRSDILKHSIAAFLVGGAICFLGQWAAELFLYLGLEEKKAYLAVTLILIVLASVATSLGIFDRLATFAGAGTLVPVTGFSNAVTSSAIDTRSEGFIAGVGTKIFTVAGPVILYSSFAGVIYGLIYFIYTLF